MQNEEILDNVHEGFKRSEQNQQEAQRKLDYLVEKADNRETNFYSETCVENRAEEYAKKWDKNVFLNDFNKRDKNAGVNVKLKDIYLEDQLPHYTWTTGDKPLIDLKELLREYTVDNDGKNMLLIFGHPGIGKSTLITWILANFIEKRDDFLVYQFASDLKYVNWQEKDILNQILRMLHLKYNELENKVLILDGFDEIHAGNDREKILNQLNQELAEISILKHFSMIITCRQNYVSEIKKIECDYIVLQAWDKKQIKRFCDIYGKVSKNITPQTNIDKLLNNKEVFGIPLILYMVLALNIKIEKSESLVDVYDQIFSIDGSSIYDRCIKNARYDRAHRISEDKIKQAIHQISQRIAFWIFENNSEKAFISQEDYETICDSVMNQMSDADKDIKRDFLIGNYFKIVKHCEGMGTQELHFIHRSIYEYFVVVYFFESLQNQTTKEEVAGKLGELLKKGHLSQQILEFIKYKFDKIKQYSLSDVTKETFQIMLRDGMTYYMKGKYKNIIDREMNIFANMLEVVHLWNFQLGKLYNLVCYLRYNCMEKLNLRSTDLNGANLIGANLGGAKLNGAKLNGANLIGADLIRVDLIGANLSEANLIGANLSGANLSGANLSGANLSGANLSGAYLRETIFDEKHIDMLHKEYDLSQSRVFIPETNEIISYRDYCTRKQK